MDKSIFDTVDQKMSILVTPKKFIAAKMEKEQRQKGASPLMIVVGVVALLGVIASLFVGGGGSGNISSKGSASGYASDIIQQGSTFRDAFDMRVSQGASTASVGIIGAGTGSSATAFTTDVISIFYQNDGLGVSSPKINTAALATQGAIWVPNDTVVITGLGSAAAERTIGITGLKEGVCSAINKTLYNTEAIPIMANISLSYDAAAGTYTDTNMPRGVNDALDAEAITVTIGSTNSDAAYNGAVLSGTAPFTFDAQFPSGANGWTSGCYANTATGPYTYIQVLTAN